MSCGSPCPSVWNVCRLPILLVLPIRALQLDMGSLKQVKLDVLADIRLVAEYLDVVESLLHIFEIIDVMDACLREIIGVDDTV